MYINDIKSNKNENIDDIIKFYEKIVQSQKKTNQSLLNENIRLRAKIRTEFSRQSDEICNNLFLNTPPQLSQIRRVKFQPTLSPIAQSPHSEDMQKHANVQNKEMKNVYVQTDEIDINSNSKNIFKNEKIINNKTTNETNNKKKYLLRENSRTITYTVPSLRVKLRRDTEKPDYNPFKTHNYFKPKKIT